MEGTRRLNGEGDVRCELSIEEEPSILFILVAWWLRSVPRDYRPSSDSRAPLSGCAKVTLGEQLSGSVQVQRWSAASAQLLERVCRRCLPVLRCVRNAAMQLAVAADQPANAR